jgi:predicted nucleic acid-binding protein
MGCRGAQGAAGFLHACAVSPTRVIHLDTSFLIRALAAGTPEDRTLRSWLREETALGMSSIGWAELLCGPIGVTEITLASRIITDPEPFLVSDAALAARLFNLGGRRRGSLLDCMIASVALRVGATLATANPADFQRLDGAGLRVVSAAGSPRA